DEAGGREQAPDRTEDAQDADETPVGEAGHRVDGALGPEERVHGGVRPVRARQLVTRRLGLVGGDVGVRLDEDEEAEYKAPQSARTSGAARHLTGEDGSRVAAYGGELAWRRLEQRGSHDRTMSADATPVRTGAAPSGPYWARNSSSSEAYEDLCDELGEEPANVALAWLLHQEGVTGPIIGPRTVAQLDDAQRAVTLRLDDDVLKRLDALFPGYQPAPEHYAW